MRTPDRTEIMKRMINMWMITSESIQVFSASPTQAAYCGKDGEDRTTLDGAGSWPVLAILIHRPSSIMIQWFSRGKN